jgi:hypothetical protein
MGLAGIETEYPTDTVFVLVQQGTESNPLSYRPTVVEKHSSVFHNVSTNKRRNLERM